MLKELAGALQTEEDAVSVGGVGEEGVVDGEALRRRREHPQARAKRECDDGEERDDGKRGHAEEAGAGPLVLVRRELEGLIVVLLQVLGGDGAVGAVATRMPARREALQSVADVLLLGDVVVLVEPLHILVRPLSDGDRPGEMRRAAPLDATG